MKKNIALLLGLVLGLGFVSCSSDDDDDEYTNGEGKYLAEMLTTLYDWKDGKRSDEGVPYQITRYDKEGRTISFEYLYDGWRRDFTYDENGDKKEEIFYDENNNITSTYKYEYNYVDSYMVRYCYNWKNQLVKTEKSEYSNKEQRIRFTEIIDSIGKDYGQVCTYSYSENTITTNINLLQDGSFLQKIVHEVDSHGNVTKTTSISRDGQTATVEYENEYDSKGRILKRTSHSDDGRVNYGYTEYTYNDDGTVKKTHTVNVYNPIPGVSNAERKEEFDLEYTYKYKKK